MAVPHKLATDEEVLAARRAVFGNDDLDWLGPEYFVPSLNDLAKTHPQWFRALEVIPSTKHQQIGTNHIHFGMVMDGGLPLEEYLSAENLLVDALLQIWELTGSTYLVDLASKLSPDGKKALRKYFGVSDVKAFRDLCRAVSNRSNQVILSRDRRLLELLLRLSVREIAMGIFAFPRLGLCIRPSWDLKVLLCSRDAAVWAQIEKVTSAPQLSLRPLYP
jgi:hypothetical protein